MSYAEACAQIRAKIESGARNGAKPACVTSTSDLTTMTQALLNNPEHQIPTYTKKNVDSKGNPTPVMKQPGKRYRDSLKPTLRQMGIDKAEVDKIDTIPMSKEQAAAIIDVASHVIKDYVDVGRRFVFPMTSTDEAQMSLRVEEVDEKVAKPNRFVKDENGNSVPQPTGKTVTTKKHNVMKARNSVPFWLRTSEDTKD